MCILPMTACKHDESGKLSRYEISATYDEANKELKGVVDFTYYNSTGNELSDLCFNLWGNAYREGAACSPVSEEEKGNALYAGKSYGGEDIVNVEGCAGWEITGDDENILKVTLNEPIYPDQTQKISISYTLSLADINHRTGVTENGAVNLGNFYPVLCAYSADGFRTTPYYSCGDPFVSECADYDVSLTIPAEYVAAASGKQTGRSAAGKNVTTRYELKNARDFAAVISKNFKVATRKVNDCELNVYYTGDSEPETCVNAAAESLSYFNDSYGAYAYPTLSVVFTGLSVSGMEYPALTMISDDISEDVATYTVVHENAHQWWYAMVGSNQVDCGWQDEGLAEYSALCFFEKYPSYGYTRTQILGTAIKAYRAYYSVYNQIFGKADTSMNRSLGEFASEYEYVNIAYNKGILLFETLRTSMGDEKFLAALKKYFTENKFRIAAYEDLVAAFAYFHDVEGLIAGYVDGKVVI